MVDIIKRLFKAFTIIRQNGGLWGSTKTLFLTDDLKDGVCVGEDEFGNRYFENNRYFFGRNRWVRYAPHFGLNYDGSYIPAQWYGWIHYRTDYLPLEDCRPQHSWMLPHTPNESGTPNQYVPYGTTRPKLFPWKPPSPPC